MIKTNPHFGKLAAGYLFPEIARRVRVFQEANPDAVIMKLGIGDTTEPIVPVVIDGLRHGVDQLANRDTYSGYGAEQGNAELRSRISDVKYGGAVDLLEIFVSDGAKPDSANIQEIFSSDSIVAVQDPAYPVYVDSNVIAGRTGSVSERGQYEGIRYMPCTEDNGFFPSEFPMDADLIYICSPNNPTGAVATFSQLKTAVDFAVEHGKIIIFDSAYERFIRDDGLPHSIYEIPDADRCAIEIGSFSKEAGFTGVRLGWTVVPKNLQYTGDRSPWEIWNRRQTTKFNGASNIVQYGGLAVLTDEGQKQTQETIDYYMANADIILDCMASIGLEHFGGRNGPMVWVKTPNGMDSWEFFNKVLTEAHVVCTPGAGFGPSGQGYVRFSAFGHRENIETAVASIRANLKL